MTNPTPPPAPPPAPSSPQGIDPSGFSDKVKDRVINEVANFVIKKAAEDIYHHPLEGIIASIPTSGLILVMLTGGLGAPSVLFVGAFYLIAYGIARLPRPPSDYECYLEDNKTPIDSITTNDSQELEDHRLLTGMFLEKCGGISENAELRKKAVDALFRAKQDPFYEKYSNQFFKCVSSKV